MLHALELLKEFCDTYFAKRDLTGALALLTEDVQWLGISDHEDICDIDEVAAHMRSDLVKMPVRCVLSYAPTASRAIGSEDGVALLRMTITVGDVSLAYRVSAVARAQAGRGRLCVLHTSPVYSGEDARESAYFVRERAVYDALLYDKQAQMDNLVKAIPGGMAKYRYVNHDFVLMDQTDGVGLLTGRTKEEYALLMANGAAPSIYLEDAPKVLDALTKAALSDEIYSLSYRVPHINGSLVWITANFKRTGVEDGCPVVHAVFTPMTSQGQLYRMLTEESNSGIVVIDTQTNEMLYSNRAAKQITGARTDTYIGKKCYEYLFGRQERCSYCEQSCFSKDEMRSLLYYVPESDRYIQVKGTNVHWADGEATIEYLEDITQLKKSGSQIDELLKQLSDLINTVPCGICLFRWDGAELYPVVVNSQLSRMLGVDALQYLRSTKELQYTHVHPDDLERLRRESYSALTSTHELDITYRTMNAQTNSYIWVRMRGTMPSTPDGAQYVYVSYYDVTQEHMAQARLLDSERALEYATEAAGLWYWRYDTLNDRAYLDERNQREYDLPPVVEHYLETWLAMGFIHRDYIETYRDAILRIRAGEKQVVFEAVIDLKDRSRHWARFRFTNLGDGRDATAMAVCTTMLIDYEKELQSKFELERNKPFLGEENLLAYAHFNLQTKKTLEYVYRDATPVAPCDRLVSMDGAANAGTLLIDSREREEFLRLNNAEYLLERFAFGESEFRIDYRLRTPGNELCWRRNILHLVRDPLGSDVLLFEYRYDIDDEKNQELTYHSLATAHYDYVARINLRSGHFVVLPKEELTYNMPPMQGTDMDAVVRALTQAHIVPEDREMTLRNTLISGIRVHLQNEDRFQFTCREMQPDGAIRHKKISMYYLDRQREIVVLTREDVTAVIQAEIQKNDLLADALRAAKQASHAKSQFLSRMSHELRTPMNAIIGLSVLAAGEIHDAKAMEDAIGKIGMSARYLLSLINDILEMSRIESGRLTLNESTFDFERLIASIDAIIHEQASNKGVDYDAVVKSFMETDYVGDETKLQQILVNILGNAVKFTPEGGKVTFSMEQIRRTDTRATLRFTVSDTGVGIDEAFMPHLFDAFAQESTSFVSTSTGTGLGLAIARSLIEMMNGQIQVRSIKGIGSVFTIEVQLGISEQSRKHKDLLDALNLATMKALVVDDDIVVCQTTQQILSDMGIQAEWVDNGRGAIERVRARHTQHNDFDTIFIDWQMPDMDGIETTRRIRGIVGRDVTVIIMTAYDWKMIEAQAREAGVDMFMEKPLFPSSIVSAFQSLYAVEHKPIKSKPPIHYDFSGKRILLTEDHPLNVEVAKRLLERAGAEVTVATNGLEAIEVFTTAPDHHFDAILMDIRMPVMDGLTAARSIRKLKKAGSHDIPIIAMTANAFDEDVEQSLASGMNAHLTKPIQPQVLFATLNKYLNP